MLAGGVERRPTDLRALVIEASRALARLDASRLEELALSCRALNRSFANAGAEERDGLATQAREARGDMVAFARILTATEGNLNVMQRLRELRLGRLEYGERPAAADRGRERLGSGHGDN